jgi:hypothetical protein
MPENNTITAQEVITIGSDPEFAIVSPTDKNRTFDACEIFKPSREPQSPDCDFGYDGHSATGEIRPRPQNHPKDAVKEIKELLERNKKLYPQVYKFNLMATNERLSLGGHIHFGHPKLTSVNPNRDLLFRQLAINLDNLLAFPCIYLENKENAQRRKDNFGYGHLSDYRGQNWGVEYRTLSSFIASEQLTNDIFYLGHAIADATINHDFKCKEITTTEGFQYAFNSEATELLKPHLTAIFKQELALPKVKKEKDYKKAVEDFINLVKKEVPLFDSEIKKGWNIDFDISDFWKVEKLETLIEKIAKILIAIHTTKRLFPIPQVRFVTGSFKDLSCPQIAKNVNIALNTLLTPDILSSQEWKKIKVYGLNAKKGNKILIGANEMKSKRRKQLLGMFWDIASNFQHSTKITDISYSHEIKYSSIAFGRKIREENLLLPEAITIIAVLLLNKELYKQTAKKGRKQVKLYLTKNKVIKSFVKHIKKADKFIAKPPVNTSKKILNIDLPFIFDLEKSRTQLDNDFRTLDGSELSEITSVMSVTAKRFRLLYKARKHCARKCSSHFSFYDSPLVKLCGRCIADRILDICQSNLGAFSDYKWSALFTGEPTNMVHCGDCGNDYPADRICSDCHYCFENCCNCDRCSNCDELVSDCQCHYCEGCDENRSDENWCCDCDRCNDCCTCTETEQEEPTTTNPTTANPTQATTTTGGSSTATGQRVYFSGGTGGVDLAQPFTPERQGVSGMPNDFETAMTEATRAIAETIGPRPNSPLDLPSNPTAEQVTEHDSILREIDRQAREEGVR